MKKQYSIQLLIVSSSLVLTGCLGNNNSKPQGGDTRGLSHFDYDVEYYDNNDFNNFVNSGNSTIKGQIEGVGIGDPYILRYNGTYYLYAASSHTAGGMAGVLGWKSDDLINWERCQGTGLDKGYVSSKLDSVTTGAYGPEVHYEDGHFYMYESKFTSAAKGPEGHHILMSDSPEGPFKEVSSGKIDSYVDGTVVKDAYENNFFLSTGEGGIFTGSMPSMTKVVDTKNIIGNTNLAGNISESPSVFEYMGKYYLTYSGLHEGVGSHQVCYSISDGWGNDDTPEGISSSFVNGANQPLLVNADADEGFIGLGSASTVLGPDLDSYYMAYQNINRRKGLDRSFNLDRLLISGNLLTTHHNRFNSIKPSLPIFSTKTEQGLTKEGALLLSSTASHDTFSAEFNLKNAKDSKLIFSYNDASNYSYISLDFDLNTIDVYQIKEGKQTLIKSVSIFGNYSYSNLHTVRISYRDGKFDLHFDESLKINAMDIDLKGGKIGYLKGENTEICYTAYSNVARGLSNELEIKQALSDIPASLYMRENQIEGMQSYSLSSNSGVFTIEGDKEYQGVSALKLGSAYDYARYLTNFNEEGRYSIEIVVSKKDQGKEIAIEVQGSDDVKLKIPTIYNSTENNFMKVSLGDFEIKSGLNQVKIQNLSNDGLELVSFKFVKKAAKNYYVSSPLVDETTSGLYFAKDNTWNFANSAIHSNNSERNYAVAMEKHIHDFDMSVDINLPTPSLYSLSNQAGVVFHVKNYAEYSDDSDRDFSAEEEATKELAFQGYYVAFTTMDVTLYRVNYFGNKTVQLEKKSLSVEANKYHNVIVTGRNNRFDVKLDGKTVITYFDDLAFTSGACGIYASSGEISYQKLKVRSLD